MAAEPHGVGFLDTRPLTVEVGSGGEVAEAQVEVLNGGAEAQVLTLEVVGLPATEPDELPLVNLSSCPDPAAEPDTPEPQPSPPPPIEVDHDATAANVAPGETICFAVTVQSAVKSEGTYTGVLAAYSSDGSIDRRELPITITAPAPKGEAVAGALRTPLPTKVTWRGAAMPGLLRFLFNQPLKVDIPVSPQLAARDASGTLAGTNAVVSVEDQDELNAIRIGDLPGAGEYTGKVSFGAGTETELTLRVADHMIAFLIIVVIGLIAAFWLDRLVNRRQPRLRLLLDLQATRDEALDDQGDAMKRLVLLGEKWPFGDDAPWQIWRGEVRQQVDRGTGLLAQRAASALTEFDAEEDAAEARKTWSYGGATLTDIRGLVRSLRELQRQAEEIARERADVVGRLSGLERGAFGDGVGAEAVAAMGSRLLDVDDGLEEIKKEQTRVRDLLVAFRNALRLIEVRKNELAADAPALAELQLQRDKLFRPGVNADAIVDIIKAVNDIEPGAAADAVLDRLRGVTEEEAAAPIEIETVQENLRTRLARSRAATGMLAWGIVLLTALSALYVGNATWGSVPDYLVALLWGSVGGEAIKLALRLIPVGSSLGR